MVCTKISIFYYSLYHFNYQISIDEKCVIVWYLVIRLILFPVMFVYMHIAFKVPL